MVAVWLNGSYSPVGVMDVVLSNWWSCRKRSGPSLEVKWGLLRAVLWESSVVLWCPKLQIIQVACLVPLPEWGISQWSDVILWVTRWDINSPLVFLASSGWLLLLWRELSGLSLEEDKPFLPAHVDGNRIHTYGYTLHCNPRQQPFDYRCSCGWA